MNATSSDAPAESAGSSGASSPVMASWGEAILLVARRLGVTASPEAVRKTASWAANLDREQDVLTTARAAGLAGAFITLRLSAVSPLLIPFTVDLGEDQIAVITGVRPGGGFTAQFLLNDTVVERNLDLADLPGGDTSRRVLFLQPIAKGVDPRVSDYAQPVQRNWLWEIFATHRPLLLELAAASAISNILLLATTLFAMQVWDRVVPARSLGTLWVLAIGVGLALALDFTLRLARASIADRLGKRADLKLSSYFFGRLLDMRNDFRPRSPGSLIAQMRDFEQVRELLTSTAFGVLIDVPFVVIFILVMWLIGGYLALVPIVAAPLIILPGLIAQRPLAALSQEGTAESALRNAILMESVYRVEDIKNLQAEARFRSLWDLTNQRTAEISLRQRTYAATLVTFSSTVQQSAYVAVMIAGVYGILNSGLSTGVVLGCSMLVSRTLSPLSQIPAALSRLQNARVAKEGLDKLLLAPIDHDPTQETYHKPVLRGRYHFERVQYAYGPEDGIAIDIPALRIKAGERIAVLGRTGAGKSTFLRLLGNMAIPQAGRIVLDGAPLSLIDIADVRRNIGSTLQDSSLFYGSLRENLVMGHPLADNQAIERALKLVCADRLLLAQPHGLDLMLRESGFGLSGGQKQVLMLARMILRDPNILLLDEPTAALDDATERQIISNLDGWLGQRTLIVSTHRHSILSIVSRVIVIDGGRIVLDAPRDEALKALSGGVQVGGPSHA